MFVYYCYFLMALVKNKKYSYIEEIRFLLFVGGVIVFLENLGEKL